MFLMGRLQSNAPASMVRCTVSNVLAGGLGQHLVYVWTLPRFQRERQLSDDVIKAVKPYDADQN